VTTQEALEALGETTAEAVLGVLSSLCPDGAERGQVAVVPEGDSPLHSLPYPVMATDVAYTEGVSGGNIFTITRLGARRLAAAMMFQEPPEEDSGAELDEIESSALGEAMNQMMAASAGALSAALGYPVDISVPSTRLLESADGGEGAYPQTPYATHVSFTLLGEPCRLIQLIPNAFVVRMSRALDTETLPEQESEDETPDVGISSVLREIPVRVSAELGRTRISLQRLADPHPGAVIELDRSVGDPVDLCVNGQRFATGELILIDQTEWAMRIRSVLPVNITDYVSPTGRT
jgi:flagellar motor switch protein FliN/FliY